MKLIIVILIAMINCYPIIIVNSNFEQTDLFLNQNDLITKIKQQENKKITIINIQTSLADGESFQNKLFKKIETLKTFKKVLKQKSTFVSPFIEYSPNQFIQYLSKDEELKSQVIPMNFQNLKGLEKLSNIQDSIMIVVFSKISSNVKVLEEITENSEQPDQVIAAEISSDETTLTQNTIYTITSNQLAGYLVFFITIFALWIAVQCNAAIQTPDRFSKQNYFIGKES